MTAITCPKCKKRMSVFEVSCFSCGFTMTDEERDRQLKEQEKERELDSLKSSSSIDDSLKHSRDQKVVRLVNKFSFGYFNRGLGELVVPIVVIVLLLIAVILFLV
jgi:uncharacterized Zn finger protein (UPF0148 family)